MKTFKVFDIKDIIIKSENNEVLRFLYFHGKIFKTNKRNNKLITYNITLISKTKNYFEFTHLSNIKLNKKDIIKISKEMIIKMKWEEYNYELFSYISYSNIK
jgi:hypothetical protein